MFRLLTLVALLAPGWAENLHLEAGPCPASLPEVACFGSAASRNESNWVRRPPRGHPDLVGSRPTVALPLGPSLKYVRQLLQTAIEVEHSTIPLYLTTGYSIRNQSSFSAQVIKSVVMEEMLHMNNAANVLNAVGGSPDFDNPNFLPKYPLVMPFLNMSADVVWFTQQSMEHYQILESTPPGGYNTSISAAYLQIVNLLTALVDQHGEGAVFTGNASYQVVASTSYGQIGRNVTGLASAKAALLGIADQGGGCPVAGQSWPAVSNISAGPLGGGVSHAARYEEILMGQEYKLTDALGKPTGPKRVIDWANVLRFAPNPALDDFAPAQCVAGGSWVVRNASFFVKQVWDDHNHTLSRSIEDSWQNCAKKCEAWTIDYNQPLAPCAMWTWRNATAHSIDGVVVPGHQCLLAQGGGPVTDALPGFMSGCQFGTVCNQSLPGRNLDGSPAPPNAVNTVGLPPAWAASDTHSPPTTPAPTLSPTALATACADIHRRGHDFAANYTALLVGLHNTFNGQPDALYSTYGTMYAVMNQAVALMETPDPRIQAGTMGVGPPWQYIPSASEYEARGRVARPILGAHTATTSETEVADTAT